MRILFSTTAGAGHFGPMVPFIRSCLDVGHEAIVAAPAAMADRVAAVGAKFWPFGDPSPDEMGAVMGKVAGMSREEANRWVVGEIFGRLDATAAVPRLREALVQWRPDVVARESAEFGAAVAAELHDVPCVRIGIGLCEMETLMLGYATPNVDALRHSYGLTSTVPSSPYYSLFPAGLEDPATVFPTRRFRDSDWVRSTGTDPFVYMTFGTVAANLPHVAQVYGEALEALAGLDVPVLITTGVDMELGTVPPNVRVERWVDQASVLSQATLVVCHGGGGSTLGALAAGVPLVVAPLFAGDQHINADRVAAVGAGVSVEATASSIRAGVESVLGNDSFRTVAQGLADELAGQASTDDAFSSR